MAQTQDPRTGDRIAKLLARAGIASRREVERMIAEGRVALGGTVLDTPATVLRSLQGVTVDGQPVALPEPTRLFLYHKPTGLLVTERDPKGRTTIYDRLPRDLPRLVPVGRLDLNTEGLLLLTTDGGFKRQLELPSTGVERSYRARAYGNVTQAQLEALADGIEIEGIRYGSIDANIERRTGANVWIEITITEGKNREVRRVLEHLGLQVSRLIRTRYGPFVLGDLPVSEVGEVKQHEVVAFRRTLKGGAPDEPIGLAAPRDGFRTPPTVDRAARVRTRPAAEPAERPVRPRVEPEGRHVARPARASAGAPARERGAPPRDERGGRPDRATGRAAFGARADDRTNADRPRTGQRADRSDDRATRGEHDAPRGGRGAGRTAFAARADRTDDRANRGERDTPRAGRGAGRSTFAPRADRTDDRPARGDRDTPRAGRGAGRSTFAPRADRTDDRDAPRADRGAGRAAFAARADDRSRGGDRPRTGQRAERTDDRPARPMRGASGGPTATKGPAGGRGAPRPGGPGRPRPGGSGGSGSGGAGTGRGGPKGRRP